MTKFAFCFFISDGGVENTLASSSSLEQNGAAKGVVALANIFSY